MGLELAFYLGKDDHLRNGSGDAVVDPILRWIVIGMVVGILAWRMTARRDLAGLVVTSLIAAAGALVAGLVDRQLGRHQPAGRGRLDCCDAWRDRSACRLSSVHAQS